MFDPGGHVFWQIVKLWAILVKDLPYIIPVKFGYIRFNRFRGDSQNVRFPIRSNVKLCSTLAAMFFGGSENFGQF